MELFAADGHDAGGCERVTGKSGMRPSSPRCVISSLPPRNGGLPITTSGAGHSGSVLSVVRIASRHSIVSSGLRTGLRTLTNLYNARPQWLVDAHAALDAAVAAAYGWPADITDDDALRELLALNSGS